MSSTAHSHLGPSASERWMNCSGSKALVRRGDLPVSDEPDYTRAGTCAHHFANLLLLSGEDAWTAIGQEYAATEFDGAMSQGVQLYLDTCRAVIKTGAEWVCEERVTLPEREDAFGTGDFAGYDAEQHILDIVDYKNGFLTVDVEHNSQLMYYGYGFLQRWLEARTVRFTVVQPNADHPDGPVRTWAISAENLCIWVQEELLPAMADDSPELTPGSWCRFCPAKLKCPALHGAFRAMATADPATAIPTSAAALGQEFSAIEGVRSYIKAVEAQVKTWLLAGKTVPGAKLVRAKTNRVFKPEAIPILEARYPEDMWKPRELKSPAQIEAIGSELRDFVREWSYSPQGQVSIAPESDRRPAVQAEPGMQVFAEYMANNRS
jgi:Protein of unknown function (DUF2800)